MKDERGEIKNKVKLKSKSGNFSKNQDRLYQRRDVIAFTK
jgi:hypothetical protein